MFPRALIIACLFTLLAGGCASRPVELNPGHPYGADLADGYSWHQVRFRWDWPENESPRWSLDLMAAHRIMSDIITRHRDDLPLWRFHRRAARDAAGHQFSFIFYSPDAAARRIVKAVRDHPLTDRLSAQGLLEKVYVTEPEDPQAILATSDPGWPKALQSTWPMFIMGVSQTWLGLIEIHAGDRVFPEQDLERGLRHYAEVGETVDEVWSEYAQHAFFHHLSGIFGYQPMIIRKRLRF